MNYCSNCSTQLQPGVAFCGSCGAATSVQPPAMQGLAQAGLEVQSYNVALVVGRIVGLAVGIAILWFIVGPMLGPDNAFGIIAAFFVLAFAGLLAGQWVTLLIMRG
jgi:hypothetical protein